MFRVYFWSFSTNLCIHNSRTGGEKPTGEVTMAIFYIQFKAGYAPCYRALKLNLHKMNQMQIVKQNVNNVI